MKKISLLFGVALGLVASVPAWAGDASPKTSFIRLERSDYSANQLQEIAAMRASDGSVAGIRVMNFDNPCANETSLVIAIDYKDTASAAQQDQFATRVELALQEVDTQIRMASAQ